MKKIIFSALFSLLVTAAVVFSNYLPDIIVTSSSGIWTDTRAYSTIDAALSAIGANERDIYIVRQETTTALTIPSTARLHFFGSGSIANSGQLTVNTRNINAGDQQIFTGAGDIDFITGSVVRSTWFSDTEEAFDVTNDDSLTLIIANSETISTNSAVGNNVYLKWESIGKALTINGGVTLSNVLNIEAENYLIFTGAGDVDFLDGTRLKLDWFPTLRAMNTWVEDEEVTLVVTGTHIVSLTEVLTSNILIDMESERGVFSDNGGAADLTINGPIDSGTYQQIFDWTGSGAILGLNYATPQAWGAVGDKVADDGAEMQAALIAVSGKTLYVPPGDYLCAATLTVGVGTQIKGAGTEATTIWGNSDADLFSAADGRWLRISNMSIKDNLSVGNRTTGSAIKLTNGSNCILQHLSVIGFYDGIEFAGGVIQTKLIQVRVTTPKNDAYTFEGSGTSITIDTCYANTPGRHGFSFTKDWSYITLISTAADTVGTGGVGVGYRFYGGSVDGKQSKVTMISPGCEASSATDNCLEITSGTDFTIINPEFNTPANDTIELIGASGGWVVRNITFIGGRAVGSTGGYGINADASYSSRIFSIGLDLQNNSSGRINDQDYLSEFLPADGNIMFDFREPVCFGHSVITGAVVGDAIVKNTGKIRSVNNAGNNTIRLIESNSNDQVQIAGGGDDVRVSGDMILDTGVGLDPDTQATVGAAGGASALPANPTGYAKIIDKSGTIYVVPYYVQ